MLLVLLLSCLLEFLISIEADSGMCEESARDVIFYCWCQISRVGVEVGREQQLLAAKFVS